MKPIGWMPQRRSRALGAAGLLCGLLLSLCLSGCERQPTESAWILATASPEDTVTQLFAEKFAQEAQRLSGGEIRIKVYPNSTLGGDRELLESCYDGDIPFLVQNTAPQVTFMSDLAIFDLPCVFESLEDCRAKLDDPDFYDLVRDVYTQGGYHLLGMADQGFRVMSTNQAVHSLADFKGQKIRTMENPYHLDFWQSLGASPTPMNFGEVYIGLQQHTIDAQENPYEVIVSNRLYEQQDYIVETNHLPHLISLIVNDEFFQGCSPEDQEILTQAAQTATQYAREQSDERISQRIAVIEESGTQVIPLSDTLRQDIRHSCQGVYDAIEESVSSQLYKAYLQEGA